MASSSSSSSSCDAAAAVPFTLLGALLTAGPAAWPACVGGGRAFLRDYAQRGTNALLWAGLLAVTWVLLLRVAALVRLWALGSRIPGPHAILADPGLAAVLRTGGDITGWYPPDNPFPPYYLVPRNQDSARFGWVSVFGRRFGYYELIGLEYWIWRQPARPLPRVISPPYYGLFEMVRRFYVPFWVLFDWGLDVIGVNSIRDSVAPASHAK
jgi:hypothetical protein